MSSADSQERNIAPLPSPDNTRGERTGCRRGCVLTAVIIGGYLFLELLTGGLLLTFAFSWLAFVDQVVPRMRVEPVAFAVSGIALGLFLTLVHLLAGWLYRGLQHTAENQWQFRWTALGTLLTLGLLAAGIAVLGVIHELYWLTKAKEPLLGGSPRIARRMASVRNLRSLGSGIAQHEGRLGRLPAVEPLVAGGPLHSWQTALLPYLDVELERNPNLALPWNHIDNRPCFSQVVPQFINPSLDVGEGESESQGYALSHYVANSRVMGTGTAARRSDFGSRSESTILLGEVGAGFRPWADPENVRDWTVLPPRSPSGRSHLGGIGVQVLMSDGSVRWIRQDIDLHVLEALADPSRVLPKNLDD